MRNILLAISGPFLWACVSASQSPTVAAGFSAVHLVDAEREPASTHEGDKFKSFQEEFGAASALNSYTGLLGYNMEKQSKLSVITKWTLMAPQDVRKSLEHASEGFEIGYHRSRATGHSSLIRVIFKADDAAEIAQNQISFQPDIASIDLPDNDHDQKLIEQGLAQIEKDLPALVSQLLQDHHYEGQHLGGRNYGRMNVVTDLGLLLPEAINAKYFGLSRLNPAKAREWSHAWRDQLDFNILSDGRVSERSQTALSEASAARAALKTPLSAQGLLRLISREHVTEAAIAQAIDVLLKNPGVLARAKQASEQGHSAEIDALVTEALRLAPVNAYQIQIVKDDVTLRSGLQLKKGQSVLVLNSVANRDTNVSKPTGFSPYSDGDPTLRLVQDEVRAAVTALVAMPGLKRVAGDQGNIERRSVIEFSSSPFKHDQYRYSFPEQFSVEWDIAQPTSALQIVSQDYPYDDYLNDYDRDEFRLCASAQLPANYTDVEMIGTIVTGLRINKFNQIKRDNKDFFFCRLEKPFRACLLKAATTQKFFYLESNDKARGAYAACEATSHLTPTEKAFYPAVMFGDDVNVRLLNTSQAKRTSGPAYDFEDYLKFYNHYTARQSLMNIVGMEKFRNANRDILLYVRLNMDFRGCMGFPVVTHDLLAKIGLNVNRDLEHQYDFCKDGVWNQQSLRREGALSSEERYFYETVMLGRKLTYQGL